MKRLNIILFLVACLAFSLVLSITAPNKTSLKAQTPTVMPDPCVNTAISKSSVPINVVSATTTQLVAPSGALSVYPCGYSFTLNSILTTATTAMLEYGTGGSCTGTTAMTGLYGAGGIVSGINLSVNQTSPLAKTPASQGVCLVSAGATVNVQGVFTYVQQ